MNCSEDLSPDAGTAKKLLLIGLNALRVKNGLLLLTEFVLIIEELQHIENIFHDHCGVFANRSLTLDALTMPSSTILF